MIYHTAASLTRPPANGDNPPMRTACPFVLLLPVVLHATAAAQDRKSRDWLTWGGDAERSGWHRGESAISRRNASSLELKWKLQVDREVPVEIRSGNSMLSAPLVVEGVRTGRGTETLVYTLSAAHQLTAINAATGKISWQRMLTPKKPAPRPANWICTNMQTATPVIDKAAGILYALSADGVLYGVSLRDGEDRFPPADFVTPFSRNWSLNLVNGVLYTSVGRGCGSTEAETVASHMIAMDIRDPGRAIRKLVTSIGKPSGAWGRGGLAWGPKGVYAQTGDGTFEPETGKWGNVILALDPKTLEVSDYFAPSNLDLLNSKDLDFGSASPLTFAHQGRQYVLSGGKDGTIFILDANSLGGADHRTPLFAQRIGNDENSYAAAGIWGAMATAVDGKGQRWVYVPMWGPVSKEVTGFTHSHGEAKEGSIMAFRFVAEGAKPALIPAWVSRNLAVPEPPVFANGVVFALSTGENTQQRTTAPLRPGEAPPLSMGSGRAGKKSSGPRVRILSPQERVENVTHATLYAFDAFTGEELYSSQEAIDDWTHLSSITLGAGKVYVTTSRSWIFAFGPKSAQN
ncbi:MAG: hypothetical protein FJW31_31150 [Acidobacteria bacterium]|nr:hypothetical protein [Acidobacteriota bacterium]